MVRQQLAKLGAAQRHLFHGTFLRTGYKRFQTHYQPTLLLGDVWHEDHQPLTDHLWFNYTKGFLRLGELLAGDQVTFFARVGSYQKGRWDHRLQDFRLQRPTKVARSGPAPFTARPALPTDPHALIGYIMVTNAAFYQANGRFIDDFYVAAYRQWRRNKDSESR